MLALTLGLGRRSLAQELEASRYDASDDVLYQFVPISWRHGQPAGNVPEVATKNLFGNFQGMRDSLPYLRTLGVTSVWMTPIFPSPAYHGYQHGPADRVNPWFGSEDEFWLFVRDANGAGIKVYLDLVAYGINQDSDYFKGAVSGTGPYAGFIAMTDAAKPFGYSFKTWDGDPVKFANWDLRQEGPRKLVTAWCKHWLDPNGDGDPSDGIAGFRLDHVWAHYAPQGKPAPDGFGYNIDSFWLGWKHDLQTLKPDVFTFAEQAKWETWGTDLMAAHDATFTKPFEFAARAALNEEKAAGLYEWMGKAVQAAAAGQDVSRDARGPRRGPARERHRGRQAREGRARQSGRGHPLAPTLPADCVLRGRAWNAGQAGKVRLRQQRHPSARAHEVARQGRRADVAVPRAGPPHGREAVQQER